MRYILIALAFALASCNSYDPNLAYPPRLVQAAPLGNAPMGTGNPAQLGRTTPYFVAEPLWP